MSKYGNDWDGYCDEQWERRQEEFYERLAEQEERDHEVGYPCDEDCPLCEREREEELEEEGVL